MREAACVARASAALALLLPAPLTIPPPFAVDGAAAWHEQLRSALAGAGVLLGGFVVIFGSMLALYAKGWLRALWALHCAWVGVLLGVPFCLAIFRACEALGWPLDAVTLALLGWNHTAAGTLLTHWAPDDDERLRTWRRAYSAALSVALAWLLTALPWLTAVMALLLLGVLDLVLVALPGAPVQKLDRLATRRRAAGERQPPGLTFKAEGLELGLGDFVIYGAVAAVRSRSGAARSTVALDRQKLLRRPRRHAAVDTLARSDAGAAEASSSCARPTGAPAPRRRRRRSRPRPGPPVARARVGLAAPRRAASARPVAQRVRALESSARRRCRRRAAMVAAFAGGRRRRARSQRRRASAARATWRGGRGADAGVLPSAMGERPRAREAPARDAGARRLVKPRDE